MWAMQIVLQTRNVATVYLVIRCVSGAIRWRKRVGREHVPPESVISAS